MRRAFSGSIAILGSTLLGALAIVDLALAQEPTTGQLLVVSEPPGAQVYVDGQQVGAAPVSVPDLLPGPHLVVVVGADGARAEQIAEVGAGRSQLVRLTLTAAPPPDGRSEADLRAQARAHYAARRFAEAEQIYRRLTQLAAGDAGVHAGLGASLLAQGRSEDAVRAYRRATELDGGNAGFFAALGAAYERASNPTGARAAYERALSIDASHRHAREGLARIAPAPSPAALPAPSPQITAEPDPASTGAPIAPATATAIPPFDAPPPTRELAPSDLGAQPQEGARDAEGVHIETRAIEPTAFPGLLGPSLGVRLDVPIYTEHPYLPFAANIGPIASSRLTLEYTFDPTWQLIGAIDFPNPAFGLGVGINIPSYIPLVRDVAIALQPRIAAIVYFSPQSAMFFSGEAELRVGFAPIPHLVLSAHLGVVVLGVVKLERTSPLIEGAHFGPIFGGGAEWAFY